MPGIAKERAESIRDMHHEFERKTGKSLTTGEAIGMAGRRFVLGPEDEMKLKKDIWRRAMAGENATSSDGRQHRLNYTVSRPRENEAGDIVKDEEWINIQTAPYQDRVKAMDEYCARAGHYVKKAKRMISIHNACYLLPGEDPIQQTFDFREDGSIDEEDNGDF